MVLRAINHSNSAVYHLDGTFHHIYQHNEANDKFEKYVT